MKNLAEIEEQPTESKTITNVGSHKDGYTINCGSSVFGISNEQAGDVVPKAGDTAHLWTVGMMIRGVAINNDVLWHHTPEEQEEQNKIEAKKVSAQRMEKFQKERASLDERIAKLPDEFQKRFAGYHERGGDEWRAEYESYELFCCEQAVSLVKNFDKNIVVSNLPDSATREEQIVGKIRSFSQMDPEDQKKAWPELDNDHSGNTFGFTMKMAIIYLEKPDAIDKVAGGLSPLVGSENYHDWITAPGNKEIAEQMKKDAEEN